MGKARQEIRFWPLLQREGPNQKQEDSTGSENRSLKLRISAALKRSDWAADRWVSDKMAFYRFQPSRERILFELLLNAASWRTSSALPAQFLSCWASWISQRIAKLQGAFFDEEFTNNGAAFLASTCQHKKCMSSFFYVITVLARSAVHPYFSFWYCYATNTAGKCDTQNVL